MMILIFNRVIKFDIVREITLKWFNSRFEKVADLFEKEAHGLLFTN